MPLLSKNFEPIAEIVGRDAMHVNGKRPTRTDAAVHEKPIAGHKNTKVSKFRVAKSCREGGLNNVS